MTDIPVAHSSVWAKLKFQLIRLRYRTDIILSLIFVTVFGVLVLFPLIKIIIVSLTYQSYDMRVIRDIKKLGTFTLYHYKRIFASDFTDAIFIKPFINSLLVGFGVTALAMFLGSLLAWAIVRTNIPWKKFFDSIIVIPYMMPSWVIALAWLIIFKNNRVAGEDGMLKILFGITPPDWFSYGLFPIIICLGLHYYSYSYLLISGALKTVNSELEEAGAIAGLKKWAVLRKITFPIVLPALGSSFVLTFTRSMGTFGTPALLGLPVRFFNIPTQIYASISMRNMGDAYVLALILVVLAAISIYINSKIVGVRKSFVTMAGKGFKNRVNNLGV